MSYIPSDLSKTIVQDQANKLTSANPSRPDLNTYITTATADGYTDLYCAVDALVPYLSSYTPIAQQAEYSATVYGPSNAGPYTPITGYPSMTFVPPQERNYTIQITLSFIPSVAADTAGFTVFVDGIIAAGYPSYSNQITFTTGQLGSTLQLSWTQVIHMLPVSHTISIGGGTYAYGDIATATYNFVNYTIWG